MSAEEVKALASECQTLLADYLKSLELAEKKPAELLKKLNRTLIQAKKAAPPYEAILFAVLSASNEVKPGLEARAKIERKLGLPFRYADAALMRMEGKPCEDQVEFLHPFYREVCTGRDSILSASLTTLNHSVKKSVTK
ncbi:MAG: hypothetical protein H7333_05575 [Bdellovibrionales bacterium]|nr:hypothetical protein [Oligoflexia bacterium]